MSVDFEEMIQEFADEHPVWTWILARLIVCICGFGVALSAFSVIIVIAAPFVIFADTGKTNFQVWLLIPVIALFTWALCSVINYVVQEIIG